MPQILGREPALGISLVNAAVILIGTLGLKFIGGEQAALLVILINAVFAAITAYAVRPISPAVFTYLVGAGVAFVASYGLVIPIETVGALNALTIAVLGFLARGQISPQETSISKA